MSLTCTKKVAAQVRILAALHSLYVNDQNKTILNMLNCDLPDSFCDLPDTNCDLPDS